MPTPPGRGDRAKDGVAQRGDQDQGHSNGEPQRLDHQVEPRNLKQPGGEAHHEQYRHLPEAAYRTRVKAMVRGLQFAGKKAGQP